MSVPLDREPQPGALCAALGGCLGDEACDYCGAPMGVVPERRPGLFERLVDAVTRESS